MFLGTRMGKDLDAVRFSLGQYCLYVLLNGPHLPFSTVKLKQ